MESENAPVFSFVLPAFNEEANIEVLARRLLAVGEGLARPFEIVFVNDGSSDGTGGVLDRLSREDGRIRPLHFSRNFGHMAALTAGFEHAAATGAVICLDADGQHPPELIPEMVRLWETGIDIVQTIRTESEGASFTKRLTSRGFYWVLNTLSGMGVAEGAADFRLMDRQVVDALNRLPERARFIRGLVFWVGYTRAYLPFEAPERVAGVTKYGFRKMFAFAMTGITSFSTRPLQAPFYLGLGLGMVSLLLALTLVLYRMAGGPVQGWTWVLLAVLLLGTLQLWCIGIVSEYLARLYFESKARPVYLLRRPRPAEAGKDPGVGQPEDASKR